MRVSTVLIVFIIAASAFAGQPLETETARLLPQGFVKIEATGELQRSHEGTERAFPFVVEYGITDRWELTIEPVFGTSIRPKNGPRTSGAGDLEVTLTHLIHGETATLPAFAVAGEIKFPTAHNRLIGTGKTDYTGYVIASKRRDRLDLHGHLGYTVVGSPAGTHLKNLIDYALAEEFHLSARFDIVGEVVGNTSSTGDSAENPATNVPPEAATAENSALIGVRYYISPSLFFALGLSYDNNHAILVRPGITYRIGGR